jgi:hypothetical protein
MKDACIESDRQVIHNPWSTSLNILDLDGTAEKTGPASGNKTNLLTWHGLAVDG